MKRARTKAGSAPTLMHPEGPTAHLRKWCVEKAIQWPRHRLVSANYHPQSLGQYASVPSDEMDADVLGRAQKLFDWVTKP